MVSPSAPVPTPWPKASSVSWMSRQRMCLRTEPRTCHTWDLPHLVTVTATFAGAWTWTPMGRCMKPLWYSRAASVFNLPKEIVDPQERTETHRKKHCFASLKHQNRVDSARQASPTPWVAASLGWPARACRLPCSSGPKTWWLSAATAAPSTAPTRRGCRDSAWARWRPWTFPRQRPASLSLETPRPFNSATAPAGLSVRWVRSDCSETEQERE